MDTEVVKNTGYMRVDGTAADGENLRNLAVRLPAGQQPEYFMLAPGQCGATGPAPPRFPRGVLRRRHDLIHLGEQIRERQSATGVVEGREPLLPQGCTSAGIGLFVGRTSQPIEVATAAKQQLIDGAEQSGRRFDVAVFDG